MNRVKASLIFILISFLFAPLAAHAVSLQYKLFTLGDNKYRYVYTLNNNGGSGQTAPILLFDVLFDPAFYDESSLKVVGNPGSAWNGIILSSGPGFPAFYDAMAQSGGAPPGTTVNGFAVEFKWLPGGGQKPGAQPFRIYNSSSFDLLSQGVTTLADTGQPPPPFQAPLPVPTLYHWGVIVLVLSIILLVRHRELSSRKHKAI